MFRLCLFYCFFLSSTFLFSHAEIQKFGLTEDDIRISNYLNFIQAFQEQLGAHGNKAHGEIELSLDPLQISEIEENQYKKLVKRGVTKTEARKWSQVGIVTTDTYWIWLRDAVKFPSGEVGTYDRLLWKASLDGPGKVAILPLLKDSRIVLVFNYRHATRSWEIELPRGCRLYGETPEKACRRELRDETGCLTEKQVYLGSLALDTATTNTVMPVFLGYISEQIEANQEKTEAIHGLFTFTKEEIKKAFIKGFIDVDVQGETKKVPFRDPILAFGILQAESRGLL